jgi:hypothetical protein
VPGVRGRGSAGAVTDPKPGEIPHLHVRPPQRVVGVGGEGDLPTARLHANGAGLLELRGHADRALAAEEGMAAEDVYREADEAAYELWVFRRQNREQTGEPREPGRPDYSAFT